MIIQDRTCGREFKSGVRRCLKRMPTVADFRLQHHSLPVEWDAPRSGEGSGEDTPLLNLAVVIGGPRSISTIRSWPWTRLRTPPDE